jgi:hypothetical protein
MLGLGTNDRADKMVWAVASERVRSLSECLHPLSGGIRTDLGVSTLSRRAPQGAATLIPGRGAQILCPELGRPLYRPWGAVNGDRALAPSPAWLPGRRGFRPRRGAHLCFNPANCRPTTGFAAGAADRSHRTTSTFPRPLGASQQTNERGALVPSQKEQ